MRQLQISKTAGAGRSYLLAVFSGVLLGLAFPPFDWWFLAPFALIPLLLVIRGECRLRRVFLCGWAMGTVFFLLNVHPLVSAHLWSGWATGDTADFAVRASRQYIVLNVLWILLSLWCGLFYGLFALVTSFAAGASFLRLAVVAPAAFVLIPEWLRSLTMWDYSWAFLGTTLVELEGLRQLASFGGVWLLTIIVVLANVAILGIVSGLRRPRRALASAIMIAALAIAEITLSPIHRDVVSPDSRSELRVAAIQYHQDRYGLNDYMTVGLERAYLELIRQVATGRLGQIDLLVLPESIAYTVASLDGTMAESLPAEAHNEIEVWNGLFDNIIAWSGGRMAVVAGLETAESGQLHNSTVFWSSENGPVWYHKQKLVPFAEYQPLIFQFFGLTGTSFRAGNRPSLARIHDISIGAFICQEVLTPEVSRKSTAAGAQMLVSGGNDGVFADPTVARIHAKHARLRAVENGRYLARAMKTGVSAIIAPDGRIVKKSPSAEPHVVVGNVLPLDEITPFVRWGNWPTALAAILLAVALGVAAREKALARTTARNESERRSDRV